MNRQVEEAFIDQVSKSDTDLVLGIVTREGDHFIGVTGLHQIDWRNRHTAFGIMVERNQWGQGYGTEATRLVVQHAFETLNLNRVWLLVYRVQPWRHSRLMKGRLSLAR